MVKKLSVMQETGSIPRSGRTPGEGVPVFQLPILVFFFLKKNFLFIDDLAALGLSCDIWDLVP